MHKLYLYIILFTGVLINTSSSLNDGRIFWQSEAQLKWKNFKATPDESSPFKALTSWGIGYNIKYENEILEISRECYFLPEKSWVKEGHDNDYLLNHERQHFNLAQIYARKFDKEIEVYKKSIIKVDQKTGKDISKIYERIMKECYQEQQRYDKETNHSLNKEIQAQWDKHIHETLTKNN